MELRTCARQGVALVITLIMLAVITFMAVTFLVLSQRERSSAGTFVDQKKAEMAAETAMSRACAEMLANGLANTNFLSLGFKVSTNFISVDGFNPGLTANPFSVNYDYLTNQYGLAGASLPANRLNNAEWIENIASLEFNPRPPVFVVTNTLTGATDFRYYVDLNRNGSFDRNGAWPVVVMVPPGNPAGTPSYLTTNASGQLQPVSISSGPPYPWLVTNNLVGDPEWIGVLPHPNQLHSADNQFISRYAYMVVPASSTLDINYIHNNAKRNPNGEGFLRDQGVSTFEINLAAFLADLNTNMWGWYNGPNSTAYSYNTNPGPANPSFGVAFQNANDLLSYRYNPNYTTLATSAQDFALAAKPLLSTPIDLYANGAQGLMLGTEPNQSVQLPFTSTANWSGSDNPNHVFSIDDVWDSSKVGTNFVANLQNLGTSNDTYDATTFYRMAQQLGSDSAPQPKLNINFKNTDTNGHIIPGMETNLIPWTPLDFFTNAAQRMFQQLNLMDMNSNLISVTNIPIYENPKALFHAGSTNLASINYYTPAVHRVLQLAANMYDATTTRYIGRGPTNYPSVFRPVFLSTNGVVSIVGYQEVVNASDAFNGFVEPANFVTLNQYQTNINMYGVPWVIGAKKGFPNFNEMSMVNQLTVSRKLQFTNSTGVPSPSNPWQTNQFFGIGISNAFGGEIWNSYAESYGRPLQLFITNELSLIVSNQFNYTFVNVPDLGFGNNLFLNNGWPGCDFSRVDGGAGDQSFKIPLFAANNFTNGVLLSNGQFVPVAPAPFGVTYAPHFWMVLTYRFHYALIDTSVTPNRVIDFVNLVGPQPQAQIVDVTTAFTEGMSSIRDSAANNFADIWETNQANANVPPLGVLNLIDANKGQPDGLPGVTNHGQTFSQFLLNGPGKGKTSFETFDSSAGYINEVSSLSANDPLVHYTAPDLSYTPASASTSAIIPPGTPIVNGPPGVDPDGANSKTPPSGGYLPNLGKLNRNYQPWGGYPLNANPPFDTAYQVKDPLLMNSDSYDFPTNKFWDIGILGRVHRGTPWQMVYMKPYNFTPAFTPTNWPQWNNDNVYITNYFADGPNGRIVPNIVPDGLLTQPNQDYQLFDLFTSTFNQNGARGQLNVNQTNPAAWSAVLSGVNVLTNTPSGLVSATISPSLWNTGSGAALAPQVAQIVQGINNAHTNLNPQLAWVFVNNYNNTPNANALVLADIIAPLRNNVFQHEGDILATPELTINSPFLNTSQLATPGAGGINNEVLERIPQQVMSLLTLNQSPRFVIYSYGQTLHPADHSLVTGGTIYNGLCTNYQITAEIATRAVVRVDGSPDPQFTKTHPDPYGRFYPPHIVVEQFNLMAPPAH